LFIEQGSIGAGYITEVLSSKNKRRQVQTVLYRVLVRQYILKSIIKPYAEDEMGGPCSMNVEKRKAYRLLVGKPEGKRLLGRPRRRWVDNIRMDLGEVGWGDVDWVGLTKDRNRWRALVNSVLNLRVP
jgi:hypothetical protein